VPQNNAINTNENLADAKRRVLSPSHALAERTATNTTLKIAVPQWPHEPHRRGHETRKERISLDIGATSPPSVALNPSTVTTQHVAQQFG
jgi:hypothetical protein